MMQKTALVIMAILSFAIGCLYFERDDIYQDGHRQGYEEGKEYGFKTRGSLFKDLTFINSSPCDSEYGIRIEDNVIYLGKGIQFIGGLETGGGIINANVGE